VPSRYGRVSLSPGSALARAYSMAAVTQVIPAHCFASPPRLLLLLHSTISQACALCAAPAGAPFPSWRILCYCRLLFSLLSLLSARWDIILSSNVARVALGRELAASRTFTAASEALAAAQTPASGTYLYIVIVAGRDLLSALRRAAGTFPVVIRFLV